ncbi:ABC transporter substrate-binding protein [Georgenia satyanarayanai]|uniref:ABC transporter substrate-binding protein n=1 Tax=Georgenia satyanarayanai TaxID=860221 RepID=UPI0020415995|nr:ABC transporter substrate-binding protein [Georgenia satyanarayanai]MCM3660271.1 ABC transporter substrate-binding protein [Georgenia satyanarayanai]
MFRSQRRRLTTALIATAGLALTVAACSPGEEGAGSDPTATTQSAEGRPLVIWAGSQIPIVANYNPFSPTVLHGALGPIYETLFHYNKSVGGEPEGLLGESFEWAEDGRTLTVTLKEGVEWNDGEPFTADDVVYTFTHDLTSPTYLSGIEAPDEQTVVFSFEEPQYTNEFSMLGSQRIIPEHVWTEVEDAATFTDEQPVGTGPYVVDSTSESSYTLVANPSFRDGEVAVKELQYLAIDQNQSAADLLSAGQVDWAGMFVPEPERLTEDGRLGYLNTPQDPSVLYTCANADLGCQGAQTDVAVRQALNVAIDRAFINERAWAGHAAPGSPTFTLPGRDDHWVADGMPAESPQTADIEGARKILEDAGYAEGSDGIYAKDGQRASMTLTSVDGWTDYNDAATLIQEQTAEAGIEVIASTVSWNEFADSRQTGQFELIMGGVVGPSIADPYSIYDEWIAGHATAPVGEELKPGDWNFSRYSNPEVDAAVVAAGQTNDEAEKLDQYAIVQEHIVNDLPYIPLVINATQTFFDQQDFTGWPSEDDPYAFPPSWGATSAGVVLAKLTPAG